MKLPRRQRWLGLGSALLLTLLAASLVDGGERQPEIAEAPTPRTAVQPNGESAQSEKLTSTRAVPKPASEPADIALEKLKRSETQPAQSDLFKSRSWEAAQQPARALKPEPPPPPTAPPLPFTYMGKLIENGQLTVFLIHQNRSIITRAGDTIDNTYRVEEVTPEAMVLTYLPLDIRQQLPLGAVN